MNRLRALLSLSIVAIALAAAGCGSSNKTADIPSGDGSTTDTSAPAETTATTDTTSTSTGTPGETPKVANASDLKSKPQIAKPSGDPPSKLIVKDLVVGKGAKLKSGQTATVHYVGISWSTGKQFDASWDRKQTISFPIGVGQVIPGWDKGVPGMRVGGRRELVIPPDQGYGASGSPPAIGPNETLVFVIDLKKISK